MYGRDANVRGGVFGSQGYGGGIFAGMTGIGSYEQAAAGVQGLGAVWRGKTRDPDVVELQGQLNRFLDRCGYKSISTDGIVGPATCGAVAFLSSPHAESCDRSMVTSSLTGELIASLCEGYTMPTKKGTSTPASYSDDKWSETAAPQWGEFSDALRVAQAGINSELVSHGYYPDAPSAGILDAATCGAMKFVDQWGGTYSNMEGRNCQAFAFTPRKKPDATVSVDVPPPVTQPPSTYTPPPPPKTTGISTAMMVGGVLAAVAAIGAGIYYSRK